ncbi:MAG: MFS transporter [Chloroflexota bacterium]
MTAILRNPWFWVLMLIAFNALGPLRALTVHQIAYMESINIEREIAARYVGAAGLLTAAAFIIWGIVSDRIGRAWTFSLGAALLMLAVGLLYVMRGNASTLVLSGYILLFGLAEGTRSSQTTAMASDTFPNAGMGLINSIVGSLFGLGAAFGPWIVGILHDITGGYNAGFGVVIATTLISMLAFIALANRQRLSPERAKVTAPASGD